MENFDERWIEKCVKNKRNWFMKANIEWFCLTKETELSTSFVCYIKISCDFDERSIAVGRNIRCWVMFVWSLVSNLMKIRLQIMGKNNLSSEPKMTQYSSSILHFFISSFVSQSKMSSKKRPEKRFLRRFQDNWFGPKRSVVWLISRRSGKRHFYDCLCWNETDA